MESSAIPLATAAGTTAAARSQWPKRDRRHYRPAATATPAGSPAARSPEGVAPSLLGDGFRGTLPAMGRIFETRKATMFARWDQMSKAFARIGKEITIAVRAGGPTPENNPGLRRVIQNARALNMPKDKVEAAIKRAAGQGAESYE